MAQCADCSRRGMPSPSSVAALFEFVIAMIRSIFAAAFLGHGFGIIPAPGSFAASAFPVPPSKSLVPSQNAAARLGSSIHSALGCPKEMGQKKENHIMYLYVKWNSFGLRFARRRFRH